VNTHANTQPAEGKTLKTLRELIESGRPLIYIHSPEERRVSELLGEAAQTFFANPVPVWAWSLTEGMRSGTERAGDDALDAREALDFIAAHQGPALFHLKDFHEPLSESPEVRRRLRDLYELCFDRDKFIVISSPLRVIPEELSRSLIYLELGLPDQNELSQFVRDESRALADNEVKVDTSDATFTQICHALRGLTLDEALHAIRRAIAANKTLDSNALPALFEEKRLLVNRTGMIEYVADGTRIDRVGGLEILKQWLDERRELFQMRDSVSAEIVPKGVLIMGISGCGKSLSVKAIASAFELPLYRIDMTEIFSGRHGSAEGAFVKACHMLEEIAPAVVWFDEIEMGITSSATSGEQGRIFAFFLTWMQEKASGLFVAATANRIDLLPAEMIRKGRFDEVFFVDLPIDEERVDIFRIHLKRRGIDPDALGVERLVRLTKGWTGAEVEQCVVAAVTAAHLENRQVTLDDLLHAGGKIVPLSKTMREQCDHIRSWARDRAVRASPSEFAY